MLVNSLKDLNINQNKFPLFYRDEYINYEKSISKNSSIYIYTNNLKSGFIVFKIIKLKLIRKGQLLFSTCDYNGDKNSKELEEEILIEFFLFLKNKRILDILLPPIHFSVFYTIPKDCLYYEIGLIKIENISIKDNFLQMKSNYRNEIRKLLENTNVQISFKDSLDQNSYHLIESNIKEQGLYFAQMEEFLKLGFHLRKNSLIANCEIKRELHGTVLFLYDDKTAYYMYSGNKKSQEYPGVNKLLMLKAIEYFKDKGIENVILGGHRDERYANSKIIGIQKFKMRFGASIEIGYHFIKIFSPFKYFIFTILLKIKSKVQGKKLDLINLEGLEIHSNRK
jgi:hypothetical protein